MKLKTAFIASAVWTVLVIGSAVVAIWYVSTNPLAGLSNEARGAKLGSGLGVFAGIGYACIWLPYAAAIGKQKREEREKVRLAKKSKKRKGR